ILLLAVVGAEESEGFPERLPGEGIDPRVHFRDRALLGRGIPLLDDFHEVSPAVANDPPVPGSILEHTREKCYRVSLAQVALEEPPERRRPDQRHIAGKHEERV